LEKGPAERPFSFRKCEVAPLSGAQSTPEREVFVAAAPSLEQLETMTDEELREQYNALTPHVYVGLDWFREEFTRRRAERQVRQMIRITWLIAALTAVNVAAVLVDAVK
jgi:hypothetical protein